MKKIFAVVLLFISLFTFAQYSVKTVTGSEVRWKAYKTLKTDSFSHYGTIKLKSGNVAFNGDSMVGGTFVIDMKQIDAEDMRDDKKLKLMLENHLRSDDFFDVAKYPYATFKIVSSKKTSANGYIINGVLTIKNNSKNISFPATVATSGKNTIITSSKFTFNRQDFDLTYNIFEDMVISNDVEMNVKLVLK